MEDTPRNGGAVVNQSLSSQGNRKEVDFLKLCVKIKSNITVFVLYFLRQNCICQYISTRIFLSQAVKIRKSTDQKLPPKYSVQDWNYFCPIIGLGSLIF